MVFTTWMQPRSANGKPQALSPLVEARKLAGEAEFSRMLDNAAKLSSRSSDALRLLPDPQTAMAQRTPVDNDRKRRYGDKQGKVDVECIKRLYMG
jgi:hypothetical protein